MAAALREGLRWPFVGPHGAVSDFGETLELTEASGAVFLLPRYGVWRPRSGDRKWEVVYTTNDYQEAVRRAGGHAPEEA